MVVPCLITCIAWWRWLLGAFQLRTPMRSKDSNNRSLIFVLLTTQSHSAPRIIWAHNRSSKNRFGKTSFHQQWCAAVLSSPSLWIPWKVSWVIYKILLSISLSRNEEGNYLVCHWVMSPPRWWGMHLIIKPSNVTKEPTCGQQDRWPGNLFPKGSCLDDWMLKKRHYSWIGGDCRKVDRIGYQVGEVGLSLSRSFVVANSSLHAQGGGRGSWVCDQYSFRMFLHNSAKHWGSFVSFSSSKLFTNSRRIWFWKQHCSLYRGTRSSHWGVLGRGWGRPRDEWSSSSQEFLSTSGSGSCVSWFRPLCHKYWPTLHSAGKSPQEGLSSLQRSYRTMSLWTWWMVRWPFLFQLEMTRLSQDQRTRFVAWRQLVRAILLW